jgi:hypothetical protein
MHVIHRLSAVITDVANYSIATLKPLKYRDVGCSAQYMRHKLGVMRHKRSQIVDVGPRNHQHMRWRFGVNVSEGYDLRSFQH